ncbi:unnamed protein product [Rotaria sp. Silwood2]|nr:unnamed protein product [Rotaria sp. Silwood2]CAF4112125.1 unnamed protein product [Rotaria sp. Silwood2]CAF4151556.1 unnamed protein product [Rotaria sp. Silwood2]
MVPEAATIRTRAQFVSATTPTSSQKTKKTWSARKLALAAPSTNLPISIAPKKEGYVGRRRVVLSEVGQDAIRYHFHLILGERRYPTVRNTLASLLMEHPDFPIKSETTLCRQMKRLGFGYKQMSKVAAQRGAYFRRLDDFRNDGAFIYYHDETCWNVGEE